MTSINPKHMEIALDYLIPIWKELWEAIENGLYHHYRPEYEGLMDAPANVPVDFTLRMKVWEERQKLLAALILDILGEMEGLDANATNQTIKSMVKNRIFAALTKNNLIEERQLEELTTESSHPGWKFISVH